MEKTVRVVRDICGKRISLPTDLLTYSNFQVYKNSYYPLCKQPSEGVLKKGISLLDLHNYFFCWVLFCLISPSTMDCKKLKNVYLFKNQQPTWRSIFLLNLKKNKSNSNEYRKRHSTTVSMVMISLYLVKMKTQKKSKER